MKHKNLKIMLSIAGSDNSGGAGIQCDIKTCGLHNMYCLTCLTAVTSQNSKKIKKIFEVPKELIESQISSLIDEYKIDCIKIGLIASIEQSRSILKFLNKFEKNLPIVVDPIYKSTTNKIFNSEKDYRIIYDLISKIKPTFTPNLNEAKILLKINNDCKISTLDIIEQFYEKFKCPVVITDSGSNEKFCEDFYLDKDKVIKKLVSKKIPSRNTHGTGCAFSSSLVINMSRGMTFSKSILLAKRFTKKCILNAPDFNLSYGPLGHFHDRI